MLKSCDNCKIEYDMHTGSNVCPKCGERTFIPATEQSSKTPTAWTAIPKEPPTPWKETPKTPPTKWKVSK